MIIRVYYDFEVHWIFAKDVLLQLVDISGYEVLMGILIGYLN